jgi:hypothetical protein
LIPVNRILLGTGLGQFGAKGDVTSSHFGTGRIALPSHIGHSRQASEPRSPREEVRAQCVIVDEGSAVPPIAKVDLGKRPVSFLSILIVGERFLLGQGDGGTLNRFTSARSRSKNGFDARAEASDEKSFPGNETSAMKRVFQSVLVCVFSLFLISTGRAVGRTKTQQETSTENACVSER